LSPRPPRRHLRVRESGCAAGRRGRTRRGRRRTGPHRRRAERRLSRRAREGDGTPLHWRADFDWAGLRIIGAALTRHAALPWRMTARGGRIDPARRPGEGQPQGPAAHIADGRSRPRRHGRTPDHRSESVIFDITFYGRPCGDARNNNGKVRKLTDPCPCQRSGPKCRDRQCSTCTMSSRDR
jgi:Protein of unknown function C-terminus (DUF2399)